MTKEERREHTIRAMVDMAKAKGWGWGDRDIKFWRTRPDYEIASMYKKVKQGE